METIELNVKGMMCQHCVAHVKEALSKVKGVKEVTVDLKNNKAVIKGTKLDKAQLISSVEKVGYTAE